MRAARRGLRGGAAVALPVSSISDLGDALWAADGASAGLAGGAVRVPGVPAAQQLRRRGHDRAAKGRALHATGRAAEGARWEA